MDYNDSDYEGQNLRIAGEDTSKVSSVLPPFTLPKFDFDYSLHGNYDSLVETEVFLGISSQEDSHWIEDFSRVGSSIQFNSSATESCSLPRHRNVWSEATSSESVEMLLKSVGQEEMVQDGNLTEESNSRHKQSTSTKEKQDNLRNDDKMEDADYGNSVLLPVKDEGSLSRPSQSAEVEGSSHAQGSKFSCCGTLTDDKESDLAVLTGCSNLEMKITDVYRREISGTVVASLSNEIQKNAAVLGIGIENTENASQTVTISVMGSADLDRITDMGWESLTRTTKYVPHKIDECKEDNREIHFSMGTSSKLELSKEEGGDDKSVSACGEVEKGEPLSTDETCNDVGLDIEPAVGFLGGSVVLSSAAEIQQISDSCITLAESSSISPEGEGIDVFIIENSNSTPPIGGNTELVNDPAGGVLGEIAPSSAAEVKKLSDSCITLPEILSISFQGEGTEGFKIENCDVTPTISGNTELVRDPAAGVLGGTDVASSAAEITQLSERCITLPESSSVSLQEEGIEGFKIESGDVTPICGNAELMHDPVVQQSDNEKSHFADGVFPGSNKSLDAQHSCLEPCELEELPGIPFERHCQRDNYDIDSSGKSSGSSFTGECCVRKSAVNNEDSRDTSAIQESTVDHNIGASPVITSDSPACTKVITSVTVDVCECDNNVYSFDGEYENLPLDEEVQPFFSSKGVKAFNTVVNDTDLTSSSAEVKDCIAFNASKALPLKMGNSDLSEEAKSRSSEQRSTSVLVECSSANELDHAVVSQEVTILDSLCGKPASADQSNELDKKMEPSKIDLTVLDDDEAAQGKNVPEKEKERDSEKESSILLGGQSTIEPDKIDHTSTPESGFADLSLNDARKHITSPSRNNLGNTDEVLMASETAGGCFPGKEENAHTFGTVLLKDQPTIESRKDFQCPGKSGEGTSSGNDGDALIAKDVGDFSSLNSCVGYSSEDLRAPSDRKSRRISSKSVKGSARRANQVKETTPVRQDVKGDKSSQCSSPLGLGEIMNFDSIVKTGGTFSIPASGLPDLNTSSAHSSILFQQPFTDLQQLQLRAQIIVYGSLIQGAAPDEACMISAFDGGRSIWEPAWRDCVDKLKLGKSRGSISEAFVSSCSAADAKLPDQARRLGLSESEVLSSVAARARNKDVASPAVSSMIPLSSPLWTMSTPSGDILQHSSTAKTAVLDYQIFSPTNPYQTPPSRNYVAHSTEASQAPFPMPWLTPAQSSAFDFITKYHIFSNTAPMKLSSISDSSVPIASSTKHFLPIHTGVSLVHTTHSVVPPTHITHTGSTTDVCAGPFSHDLRKVKLSSERVGDRTKKRKNTLGPEDALQISAISPLADTTSAPVVGNQLPKKTFAAEGSGHISLIARNQIEPMPSPFISSHYSTSVTVASPSVLKPKGSADQFFSLVSSSNSGDSFKKVNVNMDKRALNIEGFNKVEEAKLQAQEAAAHAAAAITHCESVWGQLDQQMNSGLKLDAESKLASAAVAIAAAASVARAAAAAAKIASTAAMQAKQMAEEAVAKPGNAKLTEYDAILISNSVNSVPNASSTFILNSGDWKNAPSLTLSAAREAARRRIEAASAATRHAANLDAIVKAAELAAEAVSHTGKIVAMVDPFSLSKLVEAGPNNYWKELQLESVPQLQPNNKNNRKSIDNSGKVLNLNNSQNDSEKGLQSTNQVSSPAPGEPVKSVVDYHAITGKDMAFGPEKENNALNSVKAAFVCPEPDFHSESGALIVLSIKEGSHVEVLRDYIGSKKAWFLGTVLGLKDGKALVGYTDLQCEEGSQQLNEWISMEAKDDDAPKIRILHPMTSMRFGRTRKRQRAAVRDYKWSVGDKVDAWLQNCWREGIIAEKNKNDETVLSVNFPDQGETELVKVWHLRPTLVWNDGQWVEWSKSGTSGASQEDTPPGQKRQKLGSTDVEMERKGKMDDNIDLTEILRNEKPRLPLSANEKLFSIGTGSTREESRPKTVRGMRSGLEKETPKVVIGFSKPTKKRKFMEVSKHYVSDKSTRPNVPSDSVKLAKYVAPQGSLRGPRNNTKVDLKEKQEPERTRGVKSGKPKAVPSSSRRADSTSSQHDGCNDSVSDDGGKGTVSAVENDSSDHIAGFGFTSNREETSGGAMVFSSQSLSQLIRKKAATGSMMPVRQGHGRIPVPSGKSAKNGSAANFRSEIVEPRRSVRRIQPTSRLLEGLQSSQISKFPSSSHDKSHRNHIKGTARGNNNTRGG